MFGYMSCRVWPKSGRCFYRLLDYKKTKAKPERFKGLGIAVDKKGRCVMDTTETLKELLKLAHESLDSKDKHIAELENKCELSARCNKELDKTNNQLEGHIAELELTIESLNYTLQSYEQEQE
jgi:hypothetical protein